MESSHKMAAISTAITTAEVFFIIIDILFQTGLVRFCHVCPPEKPTGNPFFEFRNKKHHRSYA